MAQGSPCVVAAHPAVTPSLDPPRFEMKHDRNSHPARWFQRIWMSDDHGPAYA